MSTTVGLAAFGLLALLVGSALAVDFRGVARWYAREAREFGRPFASRRRGTPAQERERENFAYWLVRGVGAVGGWAGMLALLVAASRLVLPWLFGAG